jgi:lipopolysaccharide biosynthesis glycosyltransferase
MTDILIALVTDQGFLVPSLVVARQLVKQSIHEIADIVIYTVNIDPVVVGELSRLYSRRIRFEALSERLFLPPEKAVFHRNHVPTTALGRLSLTEIIPTRYDNIVYLDGDLQIVDAISDLVTYRVPDGKILAGRGSAWLDLPHNEHNFTPDSYLANLGGVAPEDYFNSGVLAFNRETWTHAAPKALKFFFDNSALCLRHDQTALNAIFKGSVVHFRPKYNFHSVYADLYVQKNYKPAIIHFTGGSKPWNSFEPPWGTTFRRSYLDALNDHPLLTNYLSIGKASLRQRARNARAWARGSRFRRDKQTLTTKRQLFFDYARSNHFPF